MAVTKRAVQYEPDDEPDDQPFPGPPRQGNHQVERRERAGRGGEPDDGSLEGSGQSGLPDTEHQNADRDDHEGKKSADGDQAARFPNSEPAGGNSDGEAGPGTRGARETGT